MPVQRWWITATSLAALVLSATGPASAAPKKAAGSAALPAIYRQAEAELPDTLYVPYRLLDRILGANPSLRQPVFLGVRSLDSSTCRNLLADSDLCTLASELPDVSKNEDFKIWSLQMAGALNSNPNAYANSYTNKIILNKSLADTLAMDHESQACVIAHEVAHIQQDHGRQYVESANSLNDAAAIKIKAAVSNAHKAMNSELFWAQLTLGVNQATRNLEYKKGNIQAAAASEKQDDQTKAAITANFSQGVTLLNEILESTQGRTPAVIAAMRQMEGLPASLIKRTMKDVNVYLVEVNQQAMAISRQQEYEADRLAVGYLARAGINPEGCLRVVGKLSHGRYVAPSREEGSHPSYERRRAQIEEAINANAALVRRAQSQLVRPAPLTYRYDSQLQLVSVYPRTGNPTGAVNDPKSSVDTFLR